VLVLVALPWVLLVGLLRLVGRALARGRPGGVEWLLWWRYTVLAWAADAARAAPEADVYHGHDLTALTAASLIRSKATDATAVVVYDSHEIFLESRSHAARPRWARAIVAAWERQMTRKAAALITVNDACARELERRLRPRRTVVVHNCPPRWTPPDPPPDLLRRAAGIPAGAPIVLCHGGFQPNRGLEETAEAMTRPGLETAHLVYLGFRTGIIEPILADPRLAGRVHLLDAVPPDELLSWVSGADVDVMAFRPVNLNNRLSTPNKLFESLAAGVPVVSSDFPVRRAIVIDDPDGPLGAVCDPTDPDAIAGAIRSILELDGAARADLRRRCLKAAHERWNWETESRRLVELYAELERGDARA
jgi:glycosyltransferase involved in cell wall biosynthesis